MAQKKPLCVDLDGTLVLTDTLLESFFALLKKQPLAALFVWFWLLSGKTTVKRRVAERIAIAAESLPYNKPFLAWLKQEKASGRRLCLVTGSSELYAQAVAKHLGIFDEVFGSTFRHNISGTGKARLLLEQYGTRGFAYAGNSTADIPVWEVADEIIVVNATPDVKLQAARLGKISLEFGQQQLRLAIVLRAIRWHQWAKNILIFVPLLTAHQLTNAPALAAAGLAFASFCAIASAIYLMNDLVDLAADRQNEYKRHRPLAAGAMSILTAIQLALVLIAISFSLSLWLPPTFLLLVALYILINVAYSLTLKRIVVADVLIIASLYVLRIMAGSAATGVATSPWLFAFAAFVFLSLALVKRYSEIINLKQAGRTQAAGRGYVAAHGRALELAGWASSILSLLVFAFYLLSPTVQRLYDYPLLLWLLLPLFGVWLARVWHITRRGGMHEDPTVFAAKDPISYATAAAAIVVVTLAT